MKHWLNVLPKFLTGSLLEFLLVLLSYCFQWKYPGANAHRSHGKVSSPGPLVTALIFRAKNLQIAVCRFFQLSMLRFTVWRIGLFRIIRQQFWNEGKSVNWQNSLGLRFQCTSNLLQLIIYCYHCPVQLTQDQHLVFSEPWCLFNFSKSTTGLSKLVVFCCCCCSMICLFF